MRTTTRHAARYRIVEFTREHGPWMKYGFKGIAMRDDGSNDKTIVDTPVRDTYTDARAELEAEAKKAGLELRYFDGHRVAQTIIPA